MTPALLLALALALPLLAIAGLHLYWTCGGRWPGHDEASLSQQVLGLPGVLQMPAPAVTATVAALLLGLPVPLVRAAALLLAVIFLGRGAATYTGLLHRRHGAPTFVVRDRRYYAPFCLVIGGLALALGCLPSALVLAAPI